MMERHIPLNLGGITVMFPFQPYDTQRQYMESVIDALQKGHHALLESPTGTGKTLSLLCSTLGWKSNARGADRSIIYYTSRTHTQLAQAAKELKRTAYARNPSVVIGSRSQMCLNDDVKQQGDLLINRACRNAIAKNACSYYSNYEQKLETLDMNQVNDIEELGNWGRRHQCCPYYASKKVAETKASLVFMPYNYLLDTSLRKSVQLKLENSVIIFDEAHNVEGVLKDAVSGCFSQTCLKTIQESCLRLPSKLSEALTKEKHGLSRSGYDPRGTIVDEFSTKKSSKKEKEKEPKVNLMDELAEKLTNEMLEQVNRAAKILQDETRNNIEMEKTNNIDKIFKLLKTAGIEYKTSDTMITTLDSMISFWSIASVMNPVLIAKYVTALSNLSHFISLLFPGDCLSLIRQNEHEKRLNEYYVAYLEGIYEKGSIVKDFRGNLKDWTLNIWCLHPAIGLKRVIDSSCITGPKSLILTSGTLSPMQPIERELETQFKIIKQFQHVISNSQLKIMIIGQSPESASLRSNHQNTEKEEYKKAIGKTLLPLFRVLPYGTLVFFSSYALMTKVIRYWKDHSTIWKEMGNISSLFVESKTQDSFNTDMYNYKRKLSVANSRAVFFGVCRGKLSEGVNLDGNQCRTVIMTGLPYPNIQDAKVLATKGFQEKKCKNNGSVWYTQQMTRALNQTVGRVIRGKDDYGMLLLCDPRFKELKYSLSEWTQPFIPHGEMKFGDVEGEVKNFFEVHGIKITGNISESVGAFEIGFNKSKGPSDVRIRSQRLNGNVQKETIPDKPVPQNLRESMMSQYCVDSETFERVQSKRMATRQIPAEEEVVKRIKTTENFMDELMSTTQSNIVSQVSEATRSVSNEEPQPEQQEERDTNAQIESNQNNLGPRPKTKSKNSLNIFAKQKTSNRQKKQPAPPPTDVLTAGSNSSQLDSQNQNYSILKQYSDKNRPAQYKCCICLNEAKIPHKTNCKCARVVCLDEMKVLDGKSCGKCKMKLRRKDFKQCLFKSAFHSRERQPMLVVSNDNIVRSKEV